MSSTGIASFVYLLHTHVCPWAGINGSQKNLVDQTKRVEIRLNFFENILILESNLDCYALKDALKYIGIMVYAKRL